MRDLLNDKTAPVTLLMKRTILIGGEVPILYGYMGMLSHERGGGGSTAPAKCNLVTGVRQQRFKWVGLTLRRHETFQVVGAWLPFSDSQRGQVGPNRRTQT